MRFSRIRDGGGVTSIEEHPFALNDGERLLWSGVPERGVFAQQTALGRSVIGVIFLAFVVFNFRASSRAGTINGPLWFALFALGAYMLAGQLLVDAWRRGKTTYALTTGRVLIRDAPLTGFTKSFPLETITDIRLVERAGGVGDIRMRHRYFIMGLKNVRTLPTHTHPIGFLLIPDARRVHDLLLAASDARRASLAAITG